MSHQRIGGLNNAKVPSLADLCCRSGAPPRLGHLGGLLMEDRSCRVNADAPLLAGKDAAAIGSAGVVGADRLESLVWD